MSKELPVGDLSPTLLRRISHALDGNRTGKVVFVVVEKEQPYRVVRVTSNKTKADRLADGKKTYVVGPFRTTQEEDPKFLLHCHLPDSDWCAGPEITDSTSDQPNSPLGKPTDVAEITITWRRRDGKKRIRTYQWPDVDYASDDVDYNRDHEDGEVILKRMPDALFFTQAALDKFMYPYIARVHGARTAFEQRARLRAKIEDVVWAEDAIRKAGGDPDAMPYEDRIAALNESGLGEAALVQLPDGARKGDAVTVVWHKGSFPGGSSDAT